MGDLKTDIPASAVLLFFFANNGIQLQHAETKMVNMLNSAEHQHASIVIVQARLQVSFQHWGGGHILSVGCGGVLH